MTAGAQRAFSFRIPTIALAAFVALTFGITWGLVGIYIVRPE
jgi:hypothetical protein